MKTLIQTALILLNILLITAPAAAKEKNLRDSSYVIEIDGKVLIPKSDNSKLYKIEVLCHNTVVDSGTVTNSESFLLKIKKNSWYTIRITKDGYFPMTVSINTKLPENNKVEHTFHFDTELIPSSKNINDKDAVDFPIAIISYNNKKDAFAPIIDYSLNIKNSLFDIQQVNEGFTKLNEDFSKVAEDLAQVDL